MESKIKRLVVCQGSTQLIVASTVLAQREKECLSGDSIGEDYLVIVGLGICPENEDLYSRGVERMAKKLRSWNTIKCINDVTLRGVLRSVEENEIGSYESLFSIVGLAAPDELYVMRDWGIPNDLFLDAYTSATRICYGDGIGYPFSEEYFYRCLSKNPTAHASNNCKARPVDRGFFLLPYLLEDTCPMRIDQYDREQTLCQLRKLKGFVPRNYIEGVRSKIANKNVVILLLANHSSRGRMSDVDEVRAYVESLKNNYALGEKLVLIKAHPRDDKALATKVNLALIDQGVDCYPFDECSSVLPFELLFMEIFQSESINHETVEAVTFTTAGIALNVLFDIPVIAGFGKEIVESHFYQNHIAARIEHEYDLVKALETLSKTGPSFASSKI